MSLRAAPMHLPRLSGGAPLVLVAEVVMDPSPLVSPALDVWIACPRGDQVLLHPFGTRAPEACATMPVGAAPARALALVAPEKGAMEAVSRWWAADTSVPPPPFLAAASGAEALPGLLAVTADALSSALLREAGAARALAATRRNREGHETGEIPGETDPEQASPSQGASFAGEDLATLRGSAWEAARVLEGQVDPVALGDEMPRLLLRAAPCGRAIVLMPQRLVPGMERLRVVLANGSARGASIAAWLRPGGETPSDIADLAPPIPGAAWTGWRELTEDPAELSLPVSPHLGGEAVLAVGLRAGDEVAAVELAEATPSAGPRREALPPAPLSAAPQGGTAVPIETLPAAAALPPAMPPRFLPAASGNVPAAASQVPAPVAGGLLAAHPPAPQTIAARPGTAAAPFRPGFLPEALPPVRPGAASGPPPASPSDPFGPALARLPRPVAPVPVRAAEPPAHRPAPQAPWPSPVAPPLPTASNTGTALPQGRAQHGGLRLSDYERSGSYRHLELELEGLSTGANRWAVVRMKFATEEGEPRLEFRLAAGWPQVFEEWLGRQSDRFGPFLRIFRSDIQDFLELVSDERDLALIGALLSILPEVVEEGCRQAGVPAQEIPDWVAAARALQAEGTRPA